MKTYKNIGGEHTTETGEKIPHDGIVNSEQDLCAKFANKFIEVGVVAEPVAEATPEPVAEATPEPVAEATPEPVAEATPEPEPEAKPVAPAGVDVTSQFPEAVDNDLTVQKLGNTWNVLDEGDVVNDAPIKPKRNVVEFIADYLADTIEEDDWDETE